MPPLHPSSGIKDIYLNVIVLKKTEKLDNMVKEKMGSGLLGKAAGRLATKLLTADKLAAKISAVLPQKMPSKLGEMGVQATAKAVYQHGAFSVVRLSIQHVDVKKLLSQKAGADKAAKVSGVMSCCLGMAGICCRNPADKLDHTMTDKLGGVLAKKLPEILPPKLAEKGIMLEMVGFASDMEEEEYLKKTLPEEEVPSINLHAGDPEGDDQVPMCSCSIS